jgi:YbbR domain-containing protein
MAPLAPSNGLQRLAAPLRRNLAAKVFAALFAFVFWFFVNAGKRETQIFQFPLEIKNVPEHTVLVSRDRIDMVAVKLNGPGALLTSLDGRRVPITLDLSGVEPGIDVRLKIRDDMIRVPRGVRIIDVEPARIPLRLEEVRQATLPVRVIRSGEPADGYQIDSIKVAPASAVVTGPASTVAALQAVETEPLDLNGLTGSVERRVALVRAEPLLSVTPERVLARIAVKQIRLTRELKRVAVNVRNVDRPFQLRPPHVNLTVRGPEAIVRDLELEAGSVYVDGSGYGVGTHMIEADVLLPAGVELVKREPATLSLQILEKKMGVRR